MPWVFESAKPQLCFPHISRSNATLADVCTGNVTSARSSPISSCNKTIPKDSGLDGCVQQRWSISWWKSWKKQATSCQCGLNLLQCFMQTLTGLEKAIYRHWRWVVPGRRPEKQPVLNTSQINTFPSFCQWQQIDPQLSVVQQDPN